MRKKIRPAMGKWKVAGVEPAEPPKLFQCGSITNAHKLVNRVVKSVIEEIEEFLGLSK